MSLESQPEVHCGDCLHICGHHQGRDHGGAQRSYEVCQGEKYPLIIACDSIAHAHLWGIVQSNSGGENISALGPNQAQVSTYSY